MAVDLVDHGPAGPAAAAPPGPAAIEAVGLTKVFGRHVAVDGIDLRVACGEVFGYLGPNGAGKTTTIRILAGLARPTAGDVRVLGCDVVRRRDEVQRRSGYLPGDFAAYPDLTAEAYLRFLARLRPGADWELATTLADRLDLELDRRIASLSHGNRQKVGIVQSLMHRPELVVMDEPTSGLDPVAQREFLEILREVRAEGRTVFLSSHVMSEVEAIADTVAILHRGRVLVVDDVERLKARSRHRLDLTFRGPAPRALLAAVPEVREVLVSGNTARVTVDGSTATLLEVAAPHHVERVATHEADLEEIFLQYYERATP